jgi:hypothetical protein
MKELALAACVLVVAWAISRAISKWLAAKRPGAGFTYNRVAEHYLREKQDIDPAKYYVVSVDTDMGRFMALCEKRISCPITEFGTLDEAREFAKKSSKADSELIEFVYAGDMKSGDVFVDGKCFDEMAAETTESGSALR